MNLVKIYKSNPLLSQVLKFATFLSQAKEETSSETSELKWRLQSLHIENKINAGKTFSVIVKILAFYETTAETIPLN